MLSVDVLKMFKPRPEVYELVTDHYKCAPGEVTFVSSNRWDVMAGTSVGFNSIWVNRSKAPDEYLDFPPGAGAGRSQRAGGAGLAAAIAIRDWRGSAPAAYMRISPAESRTHAMPPIISIQNLSKTYAGGFQALKSINLDIERGEIFALLGPNGAGKTTLIGIICGIVNPSAGSGHRRRPRHHQGLPRRPLADRPGAAGADHRRLRDGVGTPCAFSRGLFGKPPNPAHIEKVLKALSLWDKKDARS